jgi:hypothetical protein
MVFTDAACCARDFGWSRLVLPATSLDEPRVSVPELAGDDRVSNTATPEHNRVVVSMRVQPRLRQAQRGARWWWALMMSLCGAPASNASGSSVLA